MTKTTTGWVVLIAALGMMLGSIAVDISQMKDWNQATTPAAIGLFMGHLSSVIAAFIGGKIIPDDRDGRLTRVSDMKVTEK